MKKMMITAALTVFLGAAGLSAMSTTAFDSSGFDAWRRRIAAGEAAPFTPKSMSQEEVAQLEWQLAERRKEMRVAESQALNTLNAWFRAVENEEDLKKVFDKFFSFCCAMCAWRGGSVSWDIIDGFVCGDGGQRSGRIYNRILDVCGDDLMYVEYAKEQAIIADKTQFYRDAYAAVRDEQQRICPDLLKELVRLESQQAKLGKRYGVNYVLRRKAEKLKASPVILPRAMRRYQKAAEEAESRDEAKLKGLELRKRLLEGIAGCVQQALIINPCVVSRGDVVYEPNYGDLVVCMMTGEEWPIGQRKLQEKYTRACFALGLYEKYLLLQLREVSGIDLAPQLESIKSIKKERMKLEENCKRISAGKYSTLGIRGTLAELDERLRVLKGMLDPLLERVSNEFNKLQKELSLLHSFNGLKF